jgi:hypothetical protein
LLPNTNLAPGELVALGQLATGRQEIQLPSRRAFTEAWLLWINLASTATGPARFLVNTGSAFGAAAVQARLTAAQGMVLTDWHRQPVPSWHERIYLDVQIVVPGDLVNWQLFALENTIRRDWRL